MNQTILMTIAFTAPFLATLLGCSFIFFFKSFSPKVNSYALYLSSGIMLSAGIFSLLIPAINLSKETTKHFLIPIVIGLCIGTAIMIATNFASQKINSKNNKLISLFSAITLHNIPEGLIVGFAVGSSVTTNTLTVASISIAIGIAIQNIPEGLATALPIYSFNKNKTKSFLLGTLSGIVEPMFAVLGYFLTTQISSILPWMLSLSAGTMFFVVFEELLPEANKTKTTLWETCTLITGFVIMMCLDLCI